MQHGNIDGRRKKGVVDNISNRSYHDQQSAPLLSRIRNFNNLALTSLGSFFSGPTITKPAVHFCQDGEEFSGRGSTACYEIESNADATRHCQGNERRFLLGDLESCICLPEGEDLTPIGNGYFNPQADDYYSVKQLPSSRRFETHDILASSDSNVFPLDAGALIRNNPPLLQQANLSHAHISPCRPDVRHLFGDSRILDENDVRNTYISAERSSLHDLGQHPHNPSQLKSIATTSLSATAAVFVPSSPAARALLSRNKSSMASFQTNATGHDTASNAVDAETPPLTPDSSNTGLLSPASFYTSFESVVPSYGAWTPDSSDRMPGEYEVEDDNNDKILYTNPQLLEVKEGKKREQSSTQQTGYDTSLRPLGPAAPAPASDDPEEWYGLEYTLELSSRERQPSDTQSFSAGEHSKSRESWAAIHRGTIHPFFEDEDYYQWKNWHRLLDKQQERRKHKKGFAFKARSKDLSCLFVDEMRARDVLYWQKGVYGVVAREVKERLNYIAAQCPDPYFPPKKHGLAWYLKRSRSVACIRELKVREDDIKRMALERKEM